MLKRKKLVLIILILTIIFTIFSLKTSKVYGADNITYITLSDTSIMVDNEEISEDISDRVYKSNAMNNGGSSENATDANIEIQNIININNSGTYEFTGKLSDGQIAINSNNINGDVKIVLNNVDITCENAPAIIVYNKETKSDTCNVIIELANNSTNTITGDRIKQSVEEWSDQSELLYYIEKGNDDDGSYFERYKYDGAISSDISLTFEGEGALTVNVTGKEGIESKRDITFNSGNYIINSLDDGINASTDNESVITINGGTILVNVLAEGEEGDGIDSNGYIYINGGTVYAFANEKSQDSGLDSDNGIYINGGTVVATGNMSDAISNESEQKFLHLQFNSKVTNGTLITIVDENQNPVVAFETDRAYSVLTISIPNMTDEEYYVYEGGTIEGTSENGLYTKITSYEGGTEKEYSSASNMTGPGGNRENMNDRNMIRPNNNIYIYALIIEAVLLIALIILLVVSNKKTKFEIKNKLLVLVIGIIVGIAITSVIFVINNQTNSNNIPNMRENPTFERQNNGNTPPTMPDMNNTL